MKNNTLEEIKHFPNLKALITIKEKLCVSTLDGQTIINKRDISCLKADNNYCTIVYNDKNIFCSQTLKSISTRLHFKNFVRVHRSFVVNFDKVQFINATFSEIIMEDGTKVPISRTHKKTVKAQMVLNFD